ncbi:DNA-binding protein [Serinicoccus chungangensis]|uniref:DNA-binding protein n=1 Tax=Serinicoccus chungangensis TaxID=767452 RepID=A0A0W8I5M5_9MICO|nr:TraR/DksA family transcriptional regulator [Serinicoccus chungangensis]KUG53557.1 DNA-binding protein [Serinicoccus chungangensis]
MATSVKKGGPSGASRSDRGTSGSGAHLALSVRDDESPWTAAELDELRGELVAEIDRLRREVEEAEHDLLDRGRSFGDGAGDDQADAGAATWEREHELSVTNNARDLIDQNAHALDRVEAGTYGDCESCGTPIGKMRLQAFPRATLCMTCKQKQERR